MDSTRVSREAMEEMSEAELEGLILAKDSNNDARFMLGKLMIEGSSDKVPQNENKGLNWIKEASKKGNQEAKEYKTYWDIRFDRAPNLEKITKNLNEIIDRNKSARACNVMAEINHATATNNKASQEISAQENGQAKAAAAAKYYLISAEQGDIVGMHWLGVFYHEGFGVSKDIAKAKEWLEKSAALGNCQSMFQLYMIHSGNDGQDDNFRDVPVAYNWLMKAISNGATFFEDAAKYFKDHYEDLAPVYIKQKGIDIDASKEENKTDISNMHIAYINEMKNDFSSSLSKDRLYHRPCGFINDQQIWMLGVSIHYMINTVLRMDHKDFLKAMKVDLGPVLGYTGLWALRQLSTYAKEVKDTELKRKVAVCTDIIEKLLDSGYDVLSIEKKYNFINKYGPKKCPDQQIKRAEINHLYSWTHYAPLGWFEHKKREEEQKNIAKGNKIVGAIVCNSCGAGQGSTLKHKVCSACKMVYYCSVECQRYDWKNGHKEKCKELQAAAKKKGKK